MVAPAPRHRCAVIRQESSWPMSHVAGLEATMSIALAELTDFAHLRGIHFKSHRGQWASKLRWKDHKV
jgi:hypothetical protein